MSDQAYRQFIDQLKLTVPIEEVVAARVGGLKRAGGEWKACCPFHEERTPSFYVVPDKGLFHCFGCHATGDVIGFVQRFDGLEFKEAVRELATAYGLEVPRSRRGAGRGEDKRTERLYEALGRAAELYRKKLAGPEGAPARAYLAERGLEPGVCEAFGLGWAPADGRALALAARRSGFELAVLVEAGLVRTRDDGEPYDFFRGRLVVPIRDRQGRTVGFGARLLPGVQGPKYVNTPETPLFQKGHLVFGLDLAAEAARRERHLVVVEGYTDVMAAHQAGLRQVVAVLGTATTEHHARLLRRTGAQRLTLVFDGDRAGRAAAHKALRGVLPMDGFERVEVLVLPEGSDPCDLLVARGADGGRGAAFRELLERPLDWFEFLVDGLAELGPKELADAVDAALEVVAVLPNPVEREARVRELAAAAGLSPSSVEARAREVAASVAARPGARAAAAQPERGGPRGEHAAAPRAAHAAPSTPTNAGAPAGGPPPAGAARAVRRERDLELRAWAELLGACLVDNSLVELHRGRLESAREGRGPEHEGLARVLETFCQVYEEDEAAHERDPNARPEPIDAARLSSAFAAAQAEPEEALPWEAPGAGDAREEGSAPAGHAHDPSELLAIALRIEQRARRADDVRALARGAVRALDEIERRRTREELLRAAARGEDPDAARLEAANRLFGLAGRQDPSRARGADQH